MLSLRRLCLIAVICAVRLYAQRAAAPPPSPPPSQQTDDAPAATAVSDAAKDNPAPGSVVPGSVQAQPAAAQPSAANGDLAPEAMTHKIADLVHTGQYAQARRLISGLMAAYPNDQRLVQAGQLVDQLMSAPQPASAPAASDPLAQRSSSLSGMDRIDFSALVDLAKQAEQTSDLEEQNRLLNQLMSQSKSFLDRHPEQMKIWQLRTAAAISLNEPMAGYDAGHRLIDAGGADSNDSGVQSLLGQLKNKGWLDLATAEKLQLAADFARKQQAAAEAAEAQRAEDAKFTLPVIHEYGIFVNRGWGHITVYGDRVVYYGTDRSLTILKSAVQKVGAACSNGYCAMLFYSSAMSAEVFDVVTEDAVSQATSKGAIYRKPAELGNMVVARWGFVSSPDKKSLIPPPADAKPKSKPAATHPVPEKQSSGQKMADNSANQGQQGGTASPEAAPAPVAVSSASAVLHLFRMRHLTGAGSNAYAEVDGRQVGKLENGESLRVEVPPGKHNINATDSRFKSDQPLLDTPLEAGKEYWVRVDLDAGFASAHVRLTLVSAEDAARDVSGMREVSGNAN